MTTNPVEWCGASTRGYGPMPIGPCVLRHGHDGPLHRDEAGVSWTDPRPASESSEPMCPSLDVANDNLRALLTEQRQRAETSLAMLDTASRERDDALRHAEQAERERDEARAAVTEAREACARASTELTAAKVQLDRSAATHAENAKAISELRAERDDFAAGASVEAAERDNERQRAEQAEAAVQRVRDLAEQALPDWKTEHEYHQERAERKGYSHDEASAEAYGRAIEVLTEILAALDRPEGT